MIEQLKEALHELCKPREINGNSLSKDLTVSIGSEIFFLTGVFKDGSFIGFWSHSPWGTCNDQEQGWVLISKDLEIEDSCETKTSGGSAGNNFKKWRSNISKLKGNSKKLCPEWENQAFWKITDC